VINKDLMNAKFVTEVVFLKETAIVLDIKKIVMVSVEDQSVLMNVENVGGQELYIQLVIVKEKLKTANKSVVEKLL